MLFAFNSNAIELCGQDLEVTKIGNFSTGSGGPYYGDLIIWAGAKQFQWRKRYGFEQSLLDQTMALALYAKSTGAKIDVYCKVAEQNYNARYIIVK